MQFDDILPRVGGFGRYQIIRSAVLVIFLSVFAINSQYLLMLFLFTPGHRCRLWIDDLGPGNTSSINQTLAAIRDLAPMATYHDEEMVDKCLMFTGPGSNATQKCDNGWVYDQSEVGKTIVSEFNLVCDRTVYRGIFLGVQILMQQIGVLSIGYAADRFGRKRAIIFIASWWTFFAFAAAFAPTEWAFFILWQCTSVAGIAAYQTPNVLANEIVGSERRPFVNGLLEVGYGVHCMLIGLISYAFLNWRTTLKVMGGLGALVIPLSLLLDESPRWLLTVDQLDRATHVLYKMAQTNRRKDVTKDAIRSWLLQCQPEKAAKSNTTDKLLEASSDVDAKPPTRRQGRLIQLLRVKHLSRKTLIFMLIVFGAQSMLIGPQMGVQLLQANPYVLFSLMNLFAIPWTIVTPILVGRLGRVKTIVLAQTTSSIAGLITGFLPKAYALGSSVTVILLRGVTAVSFVVYFIMAAELFPTEMRSSAHALIRFVSGACCSGVPFLFLYLADHLNARYLPFLIISAVSLVAAALSSLLPESSGKPMTDTVTDSERIYPVRLENLTDNFGECRPRAAGGDANNDKPLLTRVHGEKNHEDTVTC